MIVKLQLHLRNQMVRTISEGYLALFQLLVIEVLIITFMSEQLLPLYCTGNVIKPKSTKGGVIHTGTKPDEGLWQVNVTAPGPHSIMIIGTKGKRNSIVFTKQQVMHKFRIQF